MWHKELPGSLAGRENVAHCVPREPGREENVAHCAPREPGREGNVAHCAPREPGREGECGTLCSQGAYERRNVAHCASWV